MVLRIEPYTVRSELTAGHAGESARHPRPLLAFEHATDLQLVDVQSPVRFECCNKHAADPRFHLLVPMHRPQEALAERAVQAIVGTLHSIDAAPATGAELSLVLTTGDAIDNAQWNELEMFLALLEGGLV
ncbi:MAG: hypothetical protein M3393_07260 [Actinomycetota bacterium]|nr:hypothetical protein [Actinomycetota bacterium]